MLSSIYLQFSWSLATLQRPSRDCFVFLLCPYPDSLYCWYRFRSIRRAVAERLLERLSSRRRCSWIPYWRSRARFAEISSTRSLIASELIGQGRYRSAVAHSVSLVFHRRTASRVDCREDTALSASLSWSGHYWHSLAVFDSMKAYAWPLSTRKALAGSNYDPWSDP